MERQMFQDHGEGVGDFHPVIKPDHSHMLDQARANLALGKIESELADLLWVTAADRDMVHRSAVVGHETQSYRSGISTADVHGEVANVSAHHIARAFSLIIAKNDPWFLRILEAGAVIFQLDDGSGLALALVRYKTVTAVRLAVEDAHAVADQVGAVLEIEGVGNPLHLINGFLNSGGVIRDAVAFGTVVLDVFEAGVRRENNVLGRGYRGQGHRQDDDQARFHGVAILAVEVRRTMMRR
jgi:hypothetical protein